jgi:hypothetical protein
MAEGVCTNGRMILDGVEMSCEPITVTDTIQRLLGLASSPGRPLSSLDFGEGSGSGSGGGLTKAPTKDKSKAPKSLINKDDERGVGCMRLRGNYQYKRPISLPLYGDVIFWDELPGFIVVPPPELAAIQFHRKKLKDVEEDFERLSSRGRPSSFDRHRFKADSKRERRAIGDLTTDLALWQAVWKRYGCAGTPPWDEDNTRSYPTNVQTT